MNFVDKILKKDKIPHCSAVIVAAGSSNRMGSDKTMLPLGGVPVLMRTLKAFQNSECVDEIVVVTRGEKIMDIADLCRKYGYDKVSRVVSGGASRTESALAGVSAVKAGAALIAIHDGARPFVTEKLIEDTVAAAGKYMAAVPVVKCVDTLKVVDPKTGFVKETADREYTLRVQTPQAFNADLIKGALSRAVRCGIQYTDDSLAVEAMGAKVYTVPGDDDNIKLTTPMDKVIAEEIEKSRRAK